MGEGYGPILVSSTRLLLQDLDQKTVGIPGERTSAYLALRLLKKRFSPRVIPFDQIIPAVRDHEVDAGVIIHEGQLTYREDGLHKVIDLGEWWTQETGLPLPLGGNVIRRDLGPENIARIAALVRESISYALSHKDEALSYALQFGRGLDPQQGDQFVGMYVNERTLDYGEEGQRAVRLFLRRGYEEGLIPQSVEVEFV